MSVDKKACPGCQKPNLCGLSDGGASCWCFDIDLKLPMGTADESCYCEPCLRRLAEAKGLEP